MWWLVTEGKTFLILTFKDFQRKSRNFFSQMGNTLGLSNIKNTKRTHVGAAPHHKNRVLRKCDFVTKDYTNQPQTKPFPTNW